MFPFPKTKLDLYFLLELFDSIIELEWWTYVKYSNAAWWISDCLLVNMFHSHGDTWRCQSEESSSFCPSPKATLDLYGFGDNCENSYSFLAASLTSLFAICVVMNLRFEKVRKTEVVYSDSETPELHLSHHLSGAVEMYGNSLSPREPSKSLTPISESRRSPRFRNNSREKLTE